MTNRCWIKMVQRVLYNRKDSPWEADGKRERENTVTIKIILVFSLVDLYKDSPPRTVNWFKSVLLLLAWSSFKSILAVFQFIRALFFDPLSTNLLYWAHWAKISYILGLGRKTWPYTHHTNKLWAHH